MKKQEAREVWRERVEQWIKSGQSARAFAEANGVNVWTLRGWRARLERSKQPERGPNAAASRQAGERRRARSGAAALPFVELVASAALSPSPEDRFEIVLGGGRTIRVPARFDAQALRALVAVVDPR